MINKVRSPSGQVLAQVPVPFHDGKCHSEGLESTSIVLSLSCAALGLSKCGTLGCDRYPSSMSRFLHVVIRRRVPMERGQNTYRYIARTLDWPAKLCSRL